MRTRFSRPNCRQAMTTTGGMGPEGPLSADASSAAEFGGAVLLSLRRFRVSIGPPSAPRGAGAILVSRVIRLTERFVRRAAPQRRATLHYRSDIQAYGTLLADILGELIRWDSTERASSTDRLQRTFDALDHIYARGRGRLESGDRNHGVLSTRLDLQLDRLPQDSLAAIAATARAISTGMPLSNRQHDVLGFVAARARAFLLGEDLIDTALRDFLSETSGKASAGDSAAYDKLKRAPPAAGIATARKAGLLDTECSAGLLKEGIARLANEEDKSLQRLLKRLPTKELDGLLTIASPHRRDMTMVDTAAREELRNRFAWLIQAIGCIRPCYGDDTATASLADDPMPELRQLASKLADAADRNLTCFLEPLPTSTIAGLPDALADLGFAAEATGRICLRIGAVFDRFSANERVRIAVRMAAANPTIPNVLAAAAEAHRVALAVARLHGLDPAMLAESAQNRIGRAFKKLAAAAQKRLTEFLSRQYLGDLLAAVRAGTVSDSSANAAAVTTRGGVLAALDMLCSAAGINTRQTGNAARRKRTDWIALGSNLTLLDSLAINEHLSFTLGPLVSAAAQDGYALAVACLPSRPSAADPRVDHAFEAGLPTTTYLVAGTAVASDSAKHALIELTANNLLQIGAVTRVANRKTLSAIETWLVFAGKGVQLPDGRALLVSGCAEASFDIRRNSSGELLVAGTARHTRLASRHCTEGRQVTLLKPIYDPDGPPIQVVPGCEIRCSVEFTIDRNGETRISRLAGVETINLREVTSKMLTTLRRSFAVAIGHHTSISEDRMTEFRAFCEKQLAAESIDFWEGVEILAQYPSAEAARALYDRYISHRAEKPIYLPAPVRRRLDQAFINTSAKMEVSGNAERLVAAFRPAQRAVAKVLRADIWPKFQRGTALPR